MRYRRLTSSELYALGEAIKKVGNQKTVRELARQTGYSIGLIAKARYLMQCKPTIWSECCAGLTTINTGYNIR
jgi:hypothetical protein